MTFGEEKYKQTIVNCQGLSDRRREVCSAPRAPCLSMHFLPALYISPSAEGRIVAQPEEPGTSSAESEGRRYFDKAYQCLSPITPFDGWCPCA